MTTSVEKVSFKSKEVNLVGNMYLPTDFDSRGKYKAVVMTPPFPQVKDQAVSNYGPKFAEAGFVALNFDYVSKGESDSYTEGFRNDDDIPLKWEALRNAVSFLGSRPFVDKKNLFGFGMCGGGNIMASVAITDLRIKAVASASGMMATDMLHFGDMEVFKQTIIAANEARQKMFETGQPVEVDYFGYDDPQWLEKNADLPAENKEGFDYYGTKRGGKETYPNYSNVLIASVNETTLFNPGEQYADKMVQPYCGIFGENAATKICTQAFFERVTSEKELHEIKGASHVELYDKPEYIDQVIEKVVTFFNKHSSN